MKTIKVDIQVEVRVDDPKDHDEVSMAVNEALAELIEADELEFSIADDEDEDEDYDD